MKPTTQTQTKGERWGRRLAQRIHEAYGAPPRLATEEAISACVHFVGDAEAAGDDPTAEATAYLAWLNYALKHRKDQHPPQSPTKACVEIGTYAGRAAQWSKFRREKSTALAPKPNPYLTDDRPPEAIPTEDELRQFYADIKGKLGSYQKP